MRLTLDRQQRDEDVTIGSLVVMGADPETALFHCYTLEDAVRPDGVKIYGETAIPAGRYTVDITYSPRFKVMMPLLINVAGFVGVRIHPGNTADDTEGCILVGMDRKLKSIGRSRVAYESLFDVLDSAKRRGEPIELEILP